ncbi:beta-galactosidase [Pedobacter frigidisoli]|uniref:beta-galactosidase n=1 Tax=Pedobacter frigidisoli TaxID=2530455 RepID=UPI00293049FB|nr:beta-galactosidase [Pedobacter frigidisoli]
MIKKYQSILAFLFTLIFTTVNAQRMPASTRGTVSFDSKCMQIEGKDTFIYSAAFHYFRIPKPLWSDRFKKIKAAGFNAVESYIPWNWHERKMPKSENDFSQIDLSDLEEWMSMAEKFGLYITVRPGPYICAEWDGGGFPQWLAQKRPKNLASEVWLQGTDSEYIKWNKHWYNAVCKVVKPHQITQKTSGNSGVILFQVENEYNRIKWFSPNIKKEYLEILTSTARSSGIDVPIFTCWTDQSRKVETGPLKGVLDFVNAYPKWEIEKVFGRLTSIQERTQSDLPLMTMELQGGWYSEVSGKLSKDQDGTAPVQTQNITLYALQRGYSLINFYMLCGGTNFDDWASRQTTTTYDFGAAIQENGAVNERYRRLTAIGQFLKEHGNNLLRSEITKITSKSSDSTVKVTLRRGKDGSRYFFVRTEEHSRNHYGNIEIKEGEDSRFNFDFSLEAFGSKIFYLPPNATAQTKGEWYPKLPDPLQRPTIHADTITINNIQLKPDDLPQKWIPLKLGQTVDHFGIYGRHYIYYKATVPAFAKFSVKRIGQKVVNATEADSLTAWVNGKILVPVSQNRESITFQMPDHENEVILLFQNKGLHHHTNASLEKHWLNGPKGLEVNGRQVPLQFAYQEKKNGEHYSSKDYKLESEWIAVNLDTVKTLSDTKLLTWSRATFELPDQTSGVWYPWHLKIKASGNGFIYLNGHCIGRYWQSGPQTNFFLPECWLEFGKGKQNIISISLSKADRPINISTLLVVPESESAEFTSQAHQTTTANP